jgi:nitroimidazol reductase NimA-like FMN-containing flavoprotein (pyridoxamine 5'-phosphate oxidase superfamily)
MNNSAGVDSWSPQGPVTELSEERCWTVLDGASFGRLAMTRDGRPDVFPIDFRVDARTIIFRTAKGNTKLRDLGENAHVALEADDRTETEAVSVVVRGDATRVDDADEISRLDRLSFPTWIPTRPYVYVRIVPATLRGREFTHHLRTERRD